jgi:hypothetical protein
MRSKLAFSVLVVASLFGATTIASAQTKPATGASNQSSAESNANAMASMRHHGWRHHHSMRYSRRRMDMSRPGGRPVSRKAPD